MKNARKIYKFITHTQPTTSAIKMQLNFLPHIFSFSAYSLLVFLLHFQLEGGPHAEYITLAPCVCICVIRVRSICLRKFFVYKMFLMYCFWLFITCYSEECFFEICAHTFASAAAAATATS